MRPDDDHLEPNDTIASARMLDRGTPVKARSVEGDPDVWTFAATRGEHLTIVVTPAAQFHEVLVADPSGAVILADVHGHRAPADGDFAPHRDSVQGPGVTLTSPYGEPLRVGLEAAATGTYAVRLTQLSAADNMFWFKWDYTIELRSGD
jgi:hypothetical protein